MTVQLKEGKVSVPLWAVITIIVSLLVGGAGWISTGLQAQADANTIAMKQDIRHLTNEMQQTHELDFSQTAAISDIKTEMAGRLARIEAMLTDILRRLK